MSTPAATILARTAAEGLTVTVRGDNLVVTPPGRLSDDLRAQLRAFKPALIRWLTWDEQAARDALDAALDRIGQSCHTLDGFDLDQRRVDLEEAVNVAAHRRDHDTYVVALAAWEAHCLAVYRPSGLADMEAHP